MRSSSTRSKPYGLSLSKPSWVLAQLERIQPFGYSATERKTGLITRTWSSLVGRGLMNRPPCVARVSEAAPLTRWRTQRRRLRAITHDVSHSPAQATGTTQSGSANESASRCA
jgi:hypothetical protein